MRKFSTNKLCLLALCSVINLIGGHIALLFRLPVYLDSLGTVFAAALMGPLSGMIPGIISNLIGGVTTDILCSLLLTCSDDHRWDCRTSLSENIIS